MEKNANISKIMSKMEKRKKIKSPEKLYTNIIFLL